MTNQTGVRLSLREYQIEALERTAAAEKAGVRKQLGVAATGLGKTVMFCSLAERRGGRALILAHRDELVSQAAQKVREIWPGVDVGIVKAGDNDVHSHVVVASVQTLARQRRLAQLLAPFSPEGVTLLGRADPFELVVVDEAHHATADSYQTVLQALDAGEPTGPLLLGVTATPDRGDGKGLDTTFDEIVWSYDLLWGIRSKYLADLRGLRVRISDLDLSKVKRSRGDYEAGSAGRALEDAEAPAAILAAWQEHAADRRTIVFTPTVEVARLVAEQFTAVGVASSYVHGGTPLDERRRLLRAFSDGTCQVLANCAVLTEGFDEPRVDCIVVARPTRSRALYAQMVGRGTRLHPDKVDCLVLDVVGASDELTLVTVPSLVGVEKEFAARLGDGTATVSAMVDAHEQNQVRLGRLSAEQVNLFREVRAAGVAWVPVHHAAQPPRYERSLGQHRPTVVMLRRPGDEPDSWLAGLIMPDGSKRVLAEGLSMDMAQGVAESYVRANGNDRLTATDAPWRTRPPSTKALEAASKWRLTVDPSWNAGQLSDALDAHIARVKERQRHTARARRAEA